MRRPIPPHLPLALTLVFLASAPTPESARAGQEVPATERTLRPGDRGAAVEDLQRRLNVRLDPSPGLDIDGDYGEATRAAVVRFQRARGLDPTGLADARTRNALGTGPVAEPRVPASEVVNTEVLPRRPADSLDGPPFVTARAWVVLDGRTGAVVGGEHEAEPVPIASTTKIMTALVVLRLAQLDPKVLNEVVTFSERADRTSGSTSGVRAGEHLPVRELLYGLLLPSGNDAAVALAEHFGGRVAPPADAPDEADPLPRFIAEMNREAGALGLRETRFVNPNGLPAEGHLASARDLARLTRHALTQPEFARLVASRRRGSTLVDRAGKERAVVWTNTNRLLETEGYDGVKTGTTTAAGACLVGSGHRGDDHLIVVVLGSGSSDGRYVDARNLFRWGWRRLGQGE
jgi:D-alanyl-D-alanine carboxypeptidase (penicillin-binding protein 5/6)